MRLRVVLLGAFARIARARSFNRATAIDLFARICCDRCPKCGGARDEAAGALPCRCEHPYSRHHTAQIINPSKAAFGIVLSEIHLLEPALAAEPEPDPMIGQCQVCDCRCFKLDPPYLTAAEYLKCIEQQATSASRLHQFAVARVDDPSVSFTSGRCSARLQIESEQAFCLARSGRGLNRKKFTTGISTVGECIIAIIAALKAKA